MLEKGFGIDNVKVIKTRPNILQRFKNSLLLFVKKAVKRISGIELALWQPHWKIEKYNGDVKPENLYAVEEFEGNLLLNEGITELLKLLIGDNTATTFNNANAYIGVGNGTTAASATQTGLVGTNKAYKPMDATFPQVSGQTVTFRATFGPDDGNYDWREFTVANGNSDSAKNLNRAVENHGSKAQGDTWIVQLEVTIS